MYKERSITDEFERSFYSRCHLCELDRSCYQQYSLLWGWTVSGKKEVTKIKLSEEVVDPDDIEMLEDLIVAATNEALRAMDEKAQSSMARITGGMGGGFPF